MCTCCLGVGEGHIGAVSAVAFSRRGAKFAVSGGADKLLKVCRIARHIVHSRPGQFLNPCAASRIRFITIRQY